MHQESSDVSINNGDIENRTCYSALDKRNAVRMRSNSTHTAAGQMAGYLFQPERALFHLATSTAGAVVGIETLDDVAVLNPDGTSIREQDKHSISKSSPLHENRSGIWKTLDIWLSAIDSEEIDLDKTEFHLVTNATVSKGLAFEILNRERSPSDLTFLLEACRKAAQRTPKSIRQVARKVSARTDAELGSLLEKVRVIDNRQAVSGDELKNRLASILVLPVGHEREILQGLLGWIHDTTLELIRSGQPAWLTREAFGERYLNLIGVFHDRRFLNETAAALIPVSVEKRSAQKHRLFVKQLLWLGLPENDEQLIEAIDDFVKSSSERIRLAKTGIATLEDFRNFEHRLVTRWRNVFRATINDTVELDDKGHQQCGKKILFETLNHREPLARYETQEWYLTRGAYHRLADRPLNKPRIGWHPLYESKCIPQLDEPNI